MEDVDPHALLRPPDETIVERLAWAIDLRSIDPAAARLQHMHDAANDAQVINPWLAARVGGEQGLQPRKF